MGATEFDKPLDNDYATINTNLGSPTSASGVTGADAFSKINTVNTNLGSPSSASSVTGADAFTKINTLNSNLGSPTSASSVTGADAFAKINSLNSKIPETRAGIAEYSGLKGGGFADRVIVDITFSTPMPNISYDVFATVAGAYGDFPYITCTPDNQNNTVNGTKIIMVNNSGSTTAVNGQISWFVVARH